jgi:hypothetical protein
MQSWNLVHLLVLFTSNFNFYLSPNNTRRITPVLYTLRKIAWLYLYIFQRSATIYTTATIFKFECVFPISEIQILMFLSASTNI